MRDGRQFYSRPCTELMMSWNMRGCGVFLCMMRARSAANRADLQFKNNYVEFEKTPSNYFALCTRSAIQHALVYGLKNYVCVRSCCADKRECCRNWFAYSANLTAYIWFACYKKNHQKSTENIDGTINKTPGLRTNSIIDKCAKIFLIFRLIKPKTG